MNRSHRRLKLSCTSAIIIVLITISTLQILSVLSSYGNTADIVNAKKYSDPVEQAASLTSVKSQTDFKVPANAGDDIGISVIPLADQNTITQQAANSNNNACAKDKGKVPPSCVGHLVVIKHVINDNEGTSSFGDFTIDVSRPFSGAESPGTDITLTPGSFRVRETGPAGYTPSLSGDCSGTINAGDNKVCTVTNNDNPQTESPRVTVNQVVCTDPTPTGHNVEFTVSGVFHGTDPLTYIVQIISPSGDVIRSAEITVIANAPDPATTFIGMFFTGDPATYRIVATPNGEFATATFDAPDCTEV